MRAGAFAGGSVAGFALSWNLTNTGAIAPVLGHHYDVGLVVVGLLTSIAFLAELPVMIPGGRAIDRFGPRRVEIASLSLILAANVLLLVLPGIYAALFLRWLLGFGLGVGFVAGSIWIIEDERGRSPLGQGLFGGIALAGAGLATAIVPLLEGPLAWRSPYVTGAAVAAGGVALAVVARGARGHAGAHGPTPIRSLLGHRTLLRLGAMHSASFGFSVIVGNWIVTLLTRRLDVHYSAAGPIGGLALVLGIVGRPLGGWAVRRLPRVAYAVLVVSFAAAAGANAVLAWSPSLGVDAVAAAILGLAAGIPFGAAVNAATNAFPRSPGEAVGTMNLYAVVTIIVGTPLVGATFSAAGEGAIGFACLAGLTLLGVASVPRRDPTAGPAATLEA